MANTAVFGMYPDRLSTENAVAALKEAQFRNTDISVLFPENEGTKDFAHEKNTKAPEGAATGASSGAVIGGTLGWLVGIGALAIPGLGPFIAAGPIVAALAGVGVGARSAASRENCAQKRFWNAPARRMSRPLAKPGQTSRRVINQC